MDTSKHSKLPWQVVEWANRDKDGAVDCTGTQIADADGYLISGSTVEGCSEQEEADVSFIVRAANSHDQLVAALKELHALVLGEAPGLLDEDSGGTGRLDADIRAALAAAGD